MRLINNKLPCLLFFLLLSCTQEQDGPVISSSSEDKASSSSSYVEFSSSSNTIASSSSEVTASSSSNVIVSSSSEIVYLSSSSEEIAISSSSSSSILPSSSSSIPSSSSASLSSEYCVYATTEYCLPFGSMPAGSKCPGQGVPSNECPYREMEVTGNFAFTNFDYGTNIYFVGTDVKSKINNTLAITDNQAGCGAITVEIEGGNSSGTVTARAVATCNGTKRVLKTITARMVQKPFIQVQCGTSGERPITFSSGRTTVEFSCSQQKDDYYISCEGSNNFSLEIEGYSNIPKNGGDNGYNLPALANVQGIYPKDIVVVVSGSTSIKCGIW